MGARLPNTAFFEQDDAVCFPNGGQAMGNDDGRTVFDHRVNGMLDQSFGIRIDGRSGLVQNQDGWV